MRVGLLLFLAACEGSDDADTDDDGTDSDTTVPGSCLDTVATSIHGETAADVIDPGDVVPIVSGPQGGFHMELGMAITSSAPNVAWRIDLYDAATGELVGSVADTLFTAVADFDPGTCTGQVNGRVFIGDGSSQTHDFACALAGTALEARGWVEPFGEDGEIPTDSVEVTLDIVAGEAPC
jgi:hypothetical protein